MGHRVAFRGDDFDAVVHQRRFDDEANTDEARKNPRAAPNDDGSSRPRRALQPAKRARRDAPGLTSGSQIGGRQLSIVLWSRLEALTQLVQLFPIGAAERA